MTRQESRAWAELLMAQADGKQLQFNYSQDCWRDQECNAIEMVSWKPDRWRIKPDLPPKPSQEWLDRHNVELTGEEPRRVKSGELTYHTCNGTPMNEAPISAPRDWTYWVDKGVVVTRWPIRRKAPAVKPWTKPEQVPLGRIVRNKVNGDRKVLHTATVVKDGVLLNINGNVAAHYAAQWVFDDDGGPCGEVVK